MSSHVICPQCGGVIGPASAGRRSCTCTKGTKSVATATLDSSTSATSEGAKPGERAKICCVCGKDVTHGKRMKDAATGRYWCYDCGSANPLHQAHAMDVPCPECKKLFKPLAMVKYRDHYICGECFARHSGKAKPGSRAEDGKASLMKLVIGALALAGGLILIAYYLKSMQ
jgi:hypothetical protein